MNARKAMATILATGVAMAAGCASSSPPAAKSEKTDWDPAPATKDKQSGDSGAKWATGTGSVLQADPVKVSEIRERAASLLVRATSSDAPQLRANALEGLAPLPKRLEPLLAVGLKDPNVGVRAVAATMVGRIRVTSLASAVQPLLSDESAFVQSAAIYALSRCGETVDATPLAWMILNDPSVRVRCQTAYVLGEMGNPSARGLLIEAVGKTVPRALPIEIRLFQLQIAEALVKLGDDSQMQVIRAALYPSRPEDLEATALAVQILGLLGDRGAVDELIYLTAYRDKTGEPMPAEVRLGAAQALARLGYPQGGFIADEFLKSENPALRTQAAAVYGQIGSIQNMGKLEELLADPIGQVQVSAAAAILKVADKQAVRLGR